MLEERTSSPGERCVAGVRLRGGRLRAGGVPGVGAVRRLARPSPLLVLLIFNSRTVGRRQGMVSAQPDSPPDPFVQLICFSPNKASWFISLVNGEATGR